MTIAKGLVPDLSWGISDTDAAKSSALLTSLGSTWVRLHVEWNQTERVKGTLDPYMLARYDKAIDRALAAGQKVLLMLYQTPVWANGGKPANVPPTDPWDFASFALRIAVRYYGRVAAYEVWNEQNTSRFWNPVDPTKYTALLRAAHQAIKSGDPRALVVFGGTSTCDYAYIAKCYQAGAKGSFDVMAVHPYCWNKPPEATNLVNGRVAKDCFTAYREVRKTMSYRSDTRPIWLTEFGWTTTTQPGGVTEQTQANYLMRALEIAAADGIPVALWYALRISWGEADSYEDRFGLVHQDYTPKPAAAAFGDA